MASDRYWPQKRVSPDMPNVWYGLDQETNEPVVMKMTERENASDSERNHRVKQEATVLKDLSHAAPHRIINYRNFFLNDEDQFVLVMERAACTVGDVLDQRCLSEEETKVMIRAVLEGLQIIHKNYFCHRDIKPANLMLVDRNDLNGLKIGDFGICVSENGYSGLSGVKGTRGFMAPEVGKGTYGRPVDIWSAGAVAFKALLGRVPPVIPKQKGFPFGRKSSLTFEGPPLSSEAKDFLSKLLDSDPETRLTADMALQHPWLAMPAQGHLSNSLPAESNSVAEVVPQRIEGFEGWIQLTQPNGMIYFFNEHTGLTQWHHPGSSPLVPEPPSEVRQMEGDPAVNVENASIERRPLPAVPQSSHAPTQEANVSDSLSVLGSPDHTGGSRSPSPRRVRFNQDEGVIGENRGYDKSPDRSFMNVLSAVSAFQAPARSVSSVITPKPVVEVVPGQIQLPHQVIPNNTEVLSRQPSISVPENAALTERAKFDSSSPAVDSHSNHSHVLAKSDVSSPSIESFREHKLPDMPAAIIDEGEIEEDSKWHKVRIVYETSYYYNTETGETVWNMSDTKTVHTIPAPPPPSNAFTPPRSRTQSGSPSSIGKPANSSRSIPPTTSSNLNTGSPPIRKPSPSRTASTPADSKPAVRPSVVGRSATTGPNRTVPPTSSPKTTRAPKELPKPQK